MIPGKSLMVNSLFKSLPKNQDIISKVLHNTNSLHIRHLKSDNLQYNTLVCWFAGTNDSLTKCLMFKALFFTFSHRLRAIKTLYFLFLWIYKKIHWNQFYKEFCKKSWKKVILGTSATCSMRRPSHRPIDPAYYIEDCRISNATHNC